MAKSARNIFGIWNEINQQVPFAVHKDSWSNKNIYVIVERVEPEGNYGKAFGYVTENGVINEYFNYDPRWRETRQIPNAGVGRWEYVEGVSLEIIGKKNL
jgi:hypothetical protein